MKGVTSIHSLAITDAPTIGPFPAKVLTQRGCVSDSARSSLLKEIKKRGREVVITMTKRSTSFTDYHLFEGRSHWTCAEPGWEQVADHALDWAEAHAQALSLPG